MHYFQFNIGDYETLNLEEYEKSLEDQDGYIHSAKRQRLNKVKRSYRLYHAKKKATHTKKEWDWLVSLTGGVCYRCKTITEHFEKDHIAPIYQGGSDGIINIQPLCPPCNRGKGPETTDHRPAWLVCLIQSRI